jgi:hypothetical protein
VHHLPKVIRSPPVTEAAQHNGEQVIGELLRALLAQALSQHPHRRLGENGVENLLSALHPSRPAYVRRLPFLLGRYLGGRVAQSRPELQRQRVVTHKGLLGSWLGLGGSPFLERE